MVRSPLSAISRHSAVVQQRRHDWVVQRAARAAPCGAAALPVCAQGPGGGSPCVFWSTFLAATQGDAVPTARGAHPRIAGMLERAVRAVLAGEIWGAHKELVPH